MARQDSTERGSTYDVVLATGPTSDRKGVQVIRARNDRLELGEVRPLEAGKPFSGDVVRLRPRGESPFLCDVETDLSAEEIACARQGVPPRQADASRSGPPQVATQAYRDNWDVIYKRRTAPGSSQLN